MLRIPSVPEEEKNRLRPREMPLLRWNQPACVLNSGTLGGVVVKSSAAVYWASLATAAVLPFAAIPPLFGIAGLSDDKVILLSLLIAWVALGKAALPTPHEWRCLAPSLAFIAVAAVSARLAPEDYAAEALRYFARLLAATFLMLVALRVGQRRDHQTHFLWAVALGGGLSALLGIAEALHLQPAQPLLALFKVAPTKVGGELRVSASFQYATIAAMYFEMVTPLAIALAVTSARRGLELAGAAIAVLCTANVVLSLTRAGMLTLIGIYAALLLFGLSRRQWRSILVPSAGGAAALFAGALLLLVHNPVFDLRLVSENDADWYGAVYHAPASLTVQPNQQSTVDLDVRNEGRITWTSSGDHPFALGYRWLTADGEGVLDLPPAEVTLSHDVEPGETIRLQAALDVPDLPAGTYRLDWGMLQRDVLQFYERGWADAETRIQIVSSAAGATLPAVTPRDDAEAPWVVGRLDLWGAALRLIASHPILGLGPDNFRHFYGAELGLEGWDERIQANNLYLEVLADFGIVGFAVFIWVLVEPLRSALLRLRALEAVDAYLALGIGLGISAFLLHGMLDSFLAFTPTALLLWLLLGLAQNPQVSGR